MAKTKSELLNEEYWNARSAKLWENLEKDEVALLGKLDKQYDKLLAGIDKEIASYFTKYGTDGILEYAKMLPVLTPAEVAVLKESWKGFVDLYPEFESLAPIDSSFYKLTRLQGLQSSILAEQMKIGAKTIQQVEDHLIKTGMNAIKTANIAQGVNTAFNQINPNMVKMLVNDNWIEDGNFKSSVWGNTKKVNDFVIKDFRDGVIRGDKYDDMIKNLGQHYNTVSKSDIRRLIYTEGTHVLNEGLAQSFSQNYEEYTYKAHMDEKTSQTCQDLNGKLFKFAERQAGVNFPPMHPRCRSQFLVVIPGETELPVQKEPEAPPIQNPIDVKAKAHLQGIYDSKGYVSLSDIGNLASAQYDEVHVAFKASGLKLDDFITSMGFPTEAEYIKALEDMVKKALDDIVAKKGWIDTTHMKADLSEEGYKLANEHKAIGGLNWKSYVESLGFKTAPENQLWTKGKLTKKIDELKAEKDNILKPYGSKNDLMNMGTATEIDNFVALEDEIFSYQEKLFLKTKKEDLKIAKKELETAKESLDDFVSSNDMTKDYGGLYKSLFGGQKQTFTLKDYPLKQATIQDKIDYYDTAIRRATDPDKIDELNQLRALALEYKIYGDEYVKRLEAFTKAQAKLTTIKKSNIIKGGDDANLFSQEHKDGALWSKSPKEADNVLRDKCGEVWKNASNLEKSSAYQYTQGSGKFNRPLAGFRKPYSGGGTGWESKFNKGEGKVWIDYEHAGDEIRALTDMIDRSEYDIDIWVQRGCGFNALDNALGDSLQGMSEAQLQKFVGRDLTFGNFLSTGGSKGQGFSGDVILNIYCPRGTKMLYAEPWSAYSGGGVGKAWDGVSKQSHFGHEFEIILQRGGSYTITKVEKNGGRVYVDIEVHPEKGYNKFQQDPTEWTGAKDYNY